MKIVVYAVLKDFFDKEFCMDTEEKLTVAGLRQILAAKEPAAKDILQLCRFAIDDTFIDNQVEIQPDDIIHIIPPSSGG